MYPPQYLPWMETLIERTPFHERKHKCWWRRTVSHEWDNVGMSETKQVNYWKSSCWMSNYVITALLSECSHFCVKLGGSLHTKHFDTMLTIRMCPKTAVKLMKTFPLRTYISEELDCNCSVSTLSLIHCSKSTSANNHTLAEVISRLLQLAVLKKHCSTYTQ